MKRRRSNKPRFVDVLKQRLSLSPSAIATALFATPFAIAAAAAAAAQIGVPIPVFRDTGAYFYPGIEMTDKRDAMQLSAKNVDPAKAEKNLAESRNLLRAAPLDSDLIRSVALNLEATGNKAAAATAINTANRVSRRDGLVQMRLAQSALQRGDPATGLKHLDVYLRTRDADATDDAIARMVTIVPFADARAALASYVRSDNLWLERFLGSAVSGVKQPGDVADLLLRAKAVPDGQLLRGHYLTLFERLATQRNLEVAARLHARLPGAKPSVLANVAPTAATVGGGYIPAVWGFGDNIDVGGTPIRSGNGLALEFFGQPDATGIAGQKIFTIPRGAGPQAIFWLVADRDMNVGSRARWKLRCDAGVNPIVVESVDLMNASQRQLLRMPVPTNCTVAILQMEITGGVGGNPARIVIDRLRSGPAGDRQPPVSAAAAAN